jgi:hypothetical protein
MFSLILTIKSIQCISNLCTEIKSKLLAYLSHTHLSLSGDDYSIPSLIWPPPHYINAHSGVHCVSFALNRFNKIGGNV